VNEATLTGIAVKNTLPLTALRPSQTHVQAVRRARYNQDSLRELAESIRASGILQPILVRPVESMIHDGGRKSSAEIVAGERRWRAAELAGLAEVPIIIRHLTDSQVLEAQLVENLQREDLDALSEAEGYRELMECAQISADALADKIGKSRSYVYARVKLLGLCEEGRTAMASGKLDASRALLVARIRDSKDQAKALQLALDMDWRGENPRLSYRELVKEIGKKHATMSLVRAPFDSADATLAPGACTGCEYRTGNCVVAGVQESPDVCTDVKCWKAKERAANERRLDNARALLLPIITGEDAARILKNGGDIAGYVNLDAVCDDDRFLEAEPAKTGDEAADNAAKDAWDVRWAEHEPRTYREILGPDAKPTAVIVDPKTKRAAELMPVANVRDALKKHGIELSNWVGATPPPISKSDPAEERRREKVDEGKREKEHAFSPAPGEGDPAQGARPDHPPPSW
jgi:ParB/RepB/Spo0J family partition protein